MQNIDSDLIRGNIDTIILKTMLNEDKYGLDIIKEVSEKSSGTYELKQPTLYSCLKRLENQELISSYWVDSDIGGKRHYYKLTDKGRDFYNKKQEEWAKSKFIIDNLLSNYNYEEYRLVKKDEFDEMLEKKANAPLYASESTSENKQTELETFDETTESENEVDSEPTEIANNIELDYSAETTNFGDENEEFENEETDDLTSSFENFSNFENEQDETLNENSQDENEETDEFFELGGNDNQNFEDDETDYNSIQTSENYSETPQNDEDYPVYFSAKQENNEDEEQNNVSYETQDQSSNELNILSRLRDQDEEINTYYGDQKSYVNHLNQLDESQLEQQDLLDSSLYVHPDEVNKSINDFSEAIEKLNSFNNFQTEAKEEFESDDEDDEFDDYEDANEIFDTKENQGTPSIDASFDDLDELDELKNLSSSNFFDSDDSSDYFKTNNPSPTYVNNQNNFNDFEAENTENVTSNFDYQTEDFAQENPISEPFEEETEDDEYEFVTSNETSDFDENMRDIDKVISNNITAEYVEPSKNYYSQSTINYRNKLSDLSKYSRVTLAEENQDKRNEEAIEKAKDISEITKELEEEGIKIKEHYKATNGKKLEKNYLLANKINLMKSLIMFFGYVFVLSALYIVLNNTSLKENSWFSIKPFLLWLIPFAVILIYYAVKFMINPYKKVEAKFHSRIMMFIAIIVTIQLLLITYCVNLQLGFYSFTQSEYNHLYWIIPSIVSLAPIIDNLVYLALFKSRNFNV